MGSGEKAERSGETGARRGRGKVYASQRLTGIAPCGAGWSIGYALWERLRAWALVAALRVVGEVRPGGDEAHRPGGDDDERCPRGE